MSLLPRSLRQMRIISVPLTRPKPSVQRTTDLTGFLTYYQFQVTPLHPPSSNQLPPSGEQKPKQRWLPEEGVVKYLQAKAADTWAGFGKAKEGSWQLRVYRAGEHLADRIEFEELSLKGIDPSVGPSLANPSPEAEKGRRIPLVYPASMSSDSESVLQFKSLLEHRMPLHRRGFYSWMFIAPFTAPFMIIPVIPNLPFFFCVWRSWSHYKAYRATQYLHDLLVNDVIVPEASEGLDAIFKNFSHPKVTTEESLKNSSEKKVDHELLLKREAVPAIITLFGLKESANVELYRAIEQARLRIENGQLKA